MTNALANEFIDQSVCRISENTNRVIKCLTEIDEADIWKSPNENSNSIGNLVVHLCGNIRQYIISALGKKEDVRERSKEFSVKTGYSKSGLTAKLKDTISEATAIIQNIDEDRLTKVYAVQGFRLSGIGIIVHVTEHYSYHTGQIAFWIKQLKNKDLGFYAGVDLSEKNAD